MQRLGILGGTFDPIHYGHLRPAVEMRAALGLDAVHFVPARVSPLRAEPAAPALARLAMLQAAVAGESDLGVDARELERPGPSYTADTLAAIAAERPDTRLYLLIGSDALAQFDHWGRWQAILQLAHLVVGQRPGAEPSVPAPLAPARAASLQGLEASAAGGLWIQPITPFDLSATAIRTLAGQRGDLRYLMPAAARHYLEEQRLYDA